MNAMGALSSTTGIALVVPGYFICAGILLFAAVVAVVLGMIGKSHFTPDNLTPRVTLRQVEKDVAAAKEMAR